MTTTFTAQNLAGFTGTEHYYRHWTGALVYTDGVHYLAENGAAWLADAIASYQHEPTLNKDSLAEFQLWQLKVDGNRAVLTCRVDSDRKPVITQNIEYTDFPLPEITLYVEQSWVGDRPTKVLLLTSEH